MKRSASSASTSIDWQLPLAPVRFPLRDALMSFSDPARPPSGQASVAASASTETQGPLVVRTTEKSRVRRALSKRKRHGLDPLALNEIAPQSYPEPPADIDKRPDLPNQVAKAGVRTWMLTGEKTAVPTQGNSRMQARRQAEAQGGATWLTKDKESASSPALLTGGNGSSGGNAAGGGAEQVIRGTLTSSARAVLSHSRRFAGSPGDTSTSSPPGSRQDSHGVSAVPSYVSQWSPRRTCRGLPKPVKEWVSRGLEFTDAGLGIGDRFDLDVVNRAKRAPGHIYEQDYGNVGRYQSESSVPTKQVVSKFFSTEVHRMGARRDVQKKGDRQRPGPGTYEFKGFAQELQDQIARRPKGEAPRRIQSR